jgi:SEC-C motif-containing protein
LGFDACCAPFVSGARFAPTAEALMRSRFTAFARGVGGYLVETHHPDARSGNDRAEVDDTISKTEWLNLSIIRTKEGGAGSSTGTVEFVAAYRRKALNILASGSSPSIEQMHERSRFLCEDGRWFYRDGEQLPRYRPARGAPCWCGSGLKFKACHG